MKRTILIAVAVSVISAFTVVALKPVKPPTVKIVESVEVPPDNTNRVPVKTTTKKIATLQLPMEQVVVLAGEVDETAFNIAQQITAKGEYGLPIFLLISSPGGSVMDGALIINAIEASPVPVITVCMDLCASMAAIIHQYGSKRLMVDRSILMFHDAAGGFQGYFPHIKAQFDVVDRYITKFNAYIANRSKTSLAELELAEHTQLWIDAEDSLGKYTDGLAYVQVMEGRGSHVDMRLLLRPNRTRNNITPKFTPTNVEFLNIKWISQ
jgi:ATP-dependent protease ClpP protease subunit